MLATVRKMMKRIAPLAYRLLLFLSKVRPLVAVNDRSMVTHVFNQESKLRAIRRMKSIATQLPNKTVRIAINCICGQRTSQNFRLNIAIVRIDVIDDVRM